MTAEINKPGTKGLNHVIKAWGYSWLGLKAALKYEEAFKIELFAFIFLAPLSLWLGQTALERALLLAVLLLVLMVELINSALEAVVDRVSVDHHILSGRAKDLGSAAVFIATMNVVIVWGLFLYERFIG